MNGKKKEKRLYGMRRKEAIAGYLFLVPAALCLLVWTVIPIGTSFWYSLTDFDILTNMNFIGLENYKTMIGDKEWLSSLWKTVKYVLMYIRIIQLS